MKNLWIYLSLSLALLTSIRLLIWKALHLLCNIDISIIVSLVLILIGLCGFFHLLIFHKESLKSIKELKKESIFYLIIAGIIFYLTTQLMGYVINLTPNLGITHLIINLNILFTLIFGYILFKQKININTFIGIIISLIGLSIVSYYNNNN